MTQVYISSTFVDLQVHREAVYRAIRRLNVDVIAMEKYVATDKRPLAKCLEDVAKSDIYLGLFAWRYGYIPPKANTRKRSITELELREAEKSKRERLVFLVAEDHPWPPTYIDAVSGEPAAARKVAALREELQQELLCDFFTTPDNLAALATGAVSMALARTPVRSFSLPEELTDYATIKRVGSSLTPELIDQIRSAIADAAGSQVIEINLGTGKSWWSTRLFLLAGLAQTYTSIESLMFVSGAGRLIGMASPSVVRQALGREDPRLEQAFGGSLPQPAQFGNDRDEAVIHTAQNFRMHWAGQEDAVKRWISSAYLKQLVGENLHTATVRLDPHKRREMKDLLTEVVTQQAGLVPIVQRGKPLRVMDRIKLATSIATSELNLML